MTTKTKAVVVKTVFDRLSTDARGKLQRIEKQLVELRRDAVAQFQRNVIALGALLVDAQAVCLGTRIKGVWEDYLTHLNREYHLSRASAFRSILAYTHGQKKLTMPVLQAAQERGIQIISANPDAPFGRYTSAVARVKLPKGKMTAQQANQWLDKLTATARKLNKGNRRAGQGRATAIAGVVRCFRRTKPTDAPAWFAGLFTTILNRAGIKRTVKL